MKIKKTYTSLVLKNKNKNVKLPSPPLALIVPNIIGVGSYLNKLSR